MKVLLTATVQSHICQFHKPLVAVLHEHGCEVHVAARDNLAEKNGLKLDFVEKVFDVPFSRSPKSTDNIKAYKQLKKIINEGQYDVIHCNTPMGGIITRLAARKAREYGTKVYYTAHGFHFYKGAPKKNWIIYYPIEKFMARFCDKLITINEEDFLWSKKKFAADSFRIHGVGVDNHRYQPVSDSENEIMKLNMGFNEKQKILLCIGELLPNKNQQMLIRAMNCVVKKNPNVVLLLAGNGAEEEKLKCLVSKLNLDKYVKFLGYCTNLEDFQKISDVVISCSIREGLGLNLIEAMLSGNPIIGTRNRGHNELIKDGYNGYLVSINDVECLAEKIQVVLEDEMLRMQLGRKGVKFAQQYTIDTVREELRRIYFSDEEFL